MAQPRSARRLGWALAAVGTTVARGSAAGDVASRGMDTEVTSDSSAQFYELRSPSGQTVIARRRLTTTLGVAAYDLLESGHDPRAPSLTFRARLRYDADYGGTAEETAVTRPDKLVPGLSRGPVDLMYGYVEGRRFARGVLGFRLGRQYVTDALGWWSFDGGLLKATTPWYFATEVYGGLEQRGGLFLSTPRFERDGVWRGSRSAYEQDPSLYPSFQAAELAPAFGAAIETAGVSWLQSRLTYRRVYNTGTSNVSAFGPGRRDTETYDGMRISQERVGYSLGATSTLGGVKAAIAYDQYAQKVASAYASVDWFASPTLTMSVDYDFYQPTFDADSIFSFFSPMPMNDVAVRAAWDPTAHVALTGQVHTRVFGATPSGTERAVGSSTSARYHFGDGSIGARGAVDAGSAGERLGVDVFGERTLETRYLFQARTGVWHFRDELRPDRAATSVGYVLGTGYKLARRSTVLADFQHDISRIVGQRFRAMLWLAIALSNEP